MKRAEAMEDPAFRTAFDHAKAWTCSTVTLCWPAFPLSSCMARRHGVPPFPRQARIRISSFAPRAPPLRMGTYPFN